MRFLKPRKVPRLPSFHLPRRRRPTMLHWPPVDPINQSPSSSSRMPLRSRTSRIPARAPLTTSRRTASTWTRPLASRAHQSRNRHLRVTSPAKPWRHRSSGLHQSNQRQSRRSPMRLSGKLQPLKCQRLSLQSKMILIVVIHQYLLIHLTISKRAKPSKRRTTSTTWMSTTPLRNLLASRVISEGPCEGRATLRPLYTELRTK